MSSPSPSPFDETNLQERRDEVSEPSELSIPSWRYIGETADDACSWLDNEWFEKLLLDEKYTDVTIIGSLESVWPRESGRPHKAHHIILGPASPYFDRLIIQSKDARGDGNAEIILPDLTADAVLTILQFVYLGDYKTSSYNCAFVVQFDTKHGGLSIPGLRDHMIQGTVQYLMDQIIKIDYRSNGSYGEKSNAAKSLITHLNVFETLWKSLLNEEEKSLCDPFIDFMIESIFKQVENNSTFKNWWRNSSSVKNTVSSLVAHKVGLDLVGRPSRPFG